MSYLDMAKRTLAAKAGSPPLPTAEAVWRATLALIVQDADAAFTNDELDALRSAQIRWVDADQQVPVQETPRSCFEELPDWPAPPCASCQSLELWEDASGHWRCLYCDPPTAARRFRRQGERIRARERRPGG